MPAALTGVIFWVLMHDINQPSHRAGRFVIKSGGRVHFVRAADVDWIEAAGNCVKLHAAPRPTCCARQ